jgi:DNA-binding CsgD family transcriptional regulator
MAEWRAGPGLRAAFELGHQVDGVRDRAAYLAVVAEMLQSLLDADLVGWNAVDVESGRAEVASFPDRGWTDAELAERLLEVADEHPMVRSYLADPRGGADWSPRRLSDVVSRAELLRSRAYVDLLRPLGAEHQLTVLTARLSLGSARCWTITRGDRDFTDREVAAAVALQPTLVLLDRTVGTPAPPADDGSAAAAERVGLTPRELQVLHLVADGLTSRAIAHRLRISARTVDKHRESIHHKLGCHDRLSAVRRAQQLGVLPPPGPAR